MDHPYRWVIVAVGGLMGCVAIGTMFSLAVFLEPMAFQTGWSRTGISSAMTLNFLVLAAGNFAWGAISDRYGPRLVVLAGAVLLGLALTLASQAPTLAAFQWTYGVGVGIASSAFLAPMLALATNWFTTNRNLAVSLVSAGMGMAPMTISPLVRWLLESNDWRATMLAIGLASWAILLPAVLFVRKAPAQSGAPADSSAAASAAAPGISAMRALSSPKFFVLAGTFFLCCAAHAGPIFHTISYAIACGIAPMAAVTIYSLEGLAGLGGRVLLGLLADRIGVKPVLIAALAIQALAIATYTFVRELGEFYAVAAVFGAAYGGVMPLYATFAREYFGPHILGTVLGAAMMLSSLGMALGPLVGGWVFDQFGSYAWMFIGSAVVGAGAVVVAFAFQPVPPARLRPA